jgi:undecaprenyl-diphosphatase
VGLLIVGWAVLVGLLVAVGTSAVHSATITSFDHHITRWVVAHRTKPLDTAMKTLTWLGSWVALLVIGAVIVWLVLRHHLPVAVAILAVLAWAGEASGVALAKAVVQRPRPPEAVWLVKAHGWSWPSGHTAVAVLIFTAAVMIVAYLRRGALATWVTSGIAVVSVVAIGFSRIELGVHWTTDVIASVVFMAGWLAVVWRLFGTRIPLRAPASAAGSEAVTS